MEFDNTLKERKERILEFIKSEDYLSLKRGEMRHLLQVPKEEQADFDMIIDSLIAEGEIFETKKGKIVSARAVNLFKADFLGHPRGYGFARIENSKDNDIFIPQESTLDAMHKDKVLIRITEAAYGDKRAVGEVVRVLSKEKSGIVGTFEAGRGFGFVVPDDKKMGDIFIPKGETKGAVTGSKVIVKIIKRPDLNRSAEGVIEEIIGHKDDPGVDILSIIHQFGLPIDFGEDVYEETENIPEEVTEDDLFGREDLRELITFTIDGDDSKDFDDAVSLEKADNGNYILGVHIADVTHYVKEGSPLDKEAYKRGTSVYLVDRVIPMIPHRLSNGICSLNPNVDRLTLSCIMEIDKTGAVKNHRICQSVINSKCRMTYSNVNKVIEFGEDIEEYRDFVPVLNEMNELREILNNRRKNRGSVNFDFPEAKILLDEEGNVKEIKPYERNLATNLIEEFMLIANETVAENFYWQNIPFVYRNHEKPDNEKIEGLKKIIYAFGYRLKGKGDIHPREIQKLIESVSGKDEEHIISRMVLRSMKQAKYQAENLGHFGLAAQYYCHFTSPIRRYPDLQIHRIIKEMLKGELTEERIKHYDSILEEVSYHSSQTERNADEAERECDRLKMVQFMENKIGEEFEGIISGVTGWGIYVELNNTVEGMVPLNEIEDDFYEYDEAMMRAVGRRTGKIYSLGDRVKIKVIRVDTQARTIDFCFTE